jgi:perosamine synthetase
MIDFRIPFYRPSLTANEKEYVNDCLNSTWISSEGKYITLFEDEFAKYLGTKFSAAVSNGTGALHLALIWLGIGKGDEVIVPTFTYVPCVNTIT